MEQISNNSLTFSHISNATQQALNYIDDRRKGKIKSLQSKWGKLNNALGGGFDYGTINVIGGISGSGKSSFVNTLETDLIDLNQKENIIVLSFSLEMLSFRQVGRKLSYKMKKTTSDLYAVDNPISDQEFNTVEQEADIIKNYPIYYVDTPGTVQEVKNTILTFIDKYCKDKWLLIMYDHSLLTKQMPGESDRETISNLQRMFLEIKKIGKTTIFQLTQLNREIEADARINNPSLHFPQRKDLSSSDSMYQCADNVIIIHRPEVLGILNYGIKNYPVKDIIYIHCIKVREGEPKILSFKNQLKYNSIEEISL